MLPSAPPESVEEPALSCGGLERWVHVGSPEADLGGRARAARDPIARVRVGWVSQDPPPAPTRGASPPGSAPR